MDAINYIKTYHKEYDGKINPATVDEDGKTYYYYKFKYDYPEIYDYLTNLKVSKDHKLFINLNIFQNSKLLSHNLHIYLPDLYEGVEEIEIWCNYIIYVHIENIKSLRYIDSNCFLILNRLPQLEHIVCPGFRRTRSVQNIKVLEYKPFKKIIAYNYNNEYYQKYDFISYLDDYPEINKVFIRMLKYRDIVISRPLDKLLVNGLSKKIICESNINYIDCWVISFFKLLVKDVEHLYLKGYIDSDKDIELINKINNTNIKHLILRPYQNASVMDFKKFKYYNNNNNIIDLKIVLVQDMKINVRYIYGTVILFFKQKIKQDEINIECSNLYIDAEDIDLVLNNKTNLKINKLFVLHKENENIDGYNDKVEKFKGDKYRFKFEFKVGNSYDYKN